MTFKFKCLDCGTTIAAGENYCPGCDVHYGNVSDGLSFLPGRAAYHCEYLAPDVVVAVPMHLDNTLYGTNLWAEGKFMIIREEE